MWLETLLDESLQTRSSSPTLLVGEPNGTRLAGYSWSSPKKRKKCSKSLHNKCENEDKCKIDELTSKVTNKLYESTQRSKHPNRIALLYVYASKLAAHHMIFFCFLCGRDSLQGHIDKLQWKYIHTLNHSYYGVVCVFVCVIVFCVFHLHLQHGGREPQNHRHQWHQHAYCRNGLRSVSCQSF